MKAVFVIVLISLASNCYGRWTPTNVPINSSATNEDSESSEQDIRTISSDSDSESSEHLTKDTSTDSFNDESGFDGPDFSAVADEPETINHQGRPKVNSKSFSSSFVSTKLVKDGDVVVDKSGGIEVSDINGVRKVKKFGNILDE